MYSIYNGVKCLSENVFYFYFLLKYMTNQQENSYFIITNIIEAKLTLKSEVRFCKGNVTILINKQMSHMKSKTRASASLRICHSQPKET